MKISIIGSGNVASQLGLAFKKAGHIIVQVHSRNKKTGGELSKKLRTEFVTALTELNENTDMVLIAVQDDSIKKVILHLKLTTPLIVHTSGFTSIDIFKGKFKNYGVLYPVQTISGQVNFSALPICVEGNNTKTTSVLKKAASSISKNIFQLSSEKRQQLHLAAVLVNNFTNHLYAVAEEILSVKKIPFRILFPLIENTVTKLKSSPAKKNQTGPAVRNDKKTINAHLKLLQDPLLRKLYIAHSLHIRKLAKKKAKL